MTRTPLDDSEGPAHHQNPHSRRELFTAKPVCGHLCEVDGAYDEADTACDSPCTEHSESISHRAESAPHTEREQPEPREYAIREEAPRVTRGDGEKRSR